MQDLQQDFSARLHAAKEDADAKNVEIVAELDKFRRAFTGDPLGWAAATDEQGKPYYYNSETGKQLNPNMDELAKLRAPTVRTCSLDGWTSRITCGTSQRHTIRPIHIADAKRRRS